MASGRWVAPLDPSSSPEAIATAVSRLEIALMVSDGGSPVSSDLDWTDAGGDARSSAPVPIERALEEGALSPAGMGGALLSSSGTTGAAQGHPRPSGPPAPRRPCRRRPSPPLAQGQGIQPTPPVPHQCRGGRVAGQPGGRVQPGARRPLPSDRVLGLDGPPRRDVDQRRPRHRLPSGRSRFRRSRSTRDPVRPLGIGPPAGGHPVPVRGQHGHPGARDLRHDRGGQPDRGQPARPVHESRVRWGCRSASSCGSPATRVQPHRQAVRWWEP